MDPASPGELRSRQPPLLLWLSCPAWRCQGDLLEKRGREGGREEGERGGERGEGADRNISGCEPAAVCFSPLERCAASGVSLPAAGAATRENTGAKNVLSKAPDVSGHKLQSGETPHAPTKRPKLKITALMALCVISPQPCCWGVYLSAACVCVRQALCRCLRLARTRTHVSNLWPSNPHSYLLTGPPCAPWRAACSLQDRRTSPSSRSRLLRHRN